MLSPDMLELLAPAFAAGLVVAATHVPLGQEVLRRGIIFIDLAIAQIAALGVVFAAVIFHADHGFLPSLFAFAFALAGSALFAWLAKKASPRYQEAFIGSSFVISASLVLLLLAGHPHGGEEMESLLAGQILWTGWGQVTATALVYAVVLVLWFGLPQRRELLFFALFPVAVTLSVQLVGVYLVFASLILPALGAACFTPERRIAAGYAIAFITVTGGLLASVAADLPAGPVLVCAYAITGLAAFAASRLRTVGK